MSERAQRALVIGSDELTGEAFLHEHLVYLVTRDGRIEPYTASGAPA